MVVLVTGGSGNIGEMICRQLARDGHQVVVHYFRNKKRAYRLAQQLGSFAIQANLVLDAEVNRMVRKITSKCGGLDALVNVAGFPITKNTQSYWDLPFERIASSMYRQVFDVDTLGTVRCIRAALPHMRKRKGGRIINFASTPAISGHDKGYPFTAAKGAILSMTRSLALDLARYKITVNAVALGTIMTHWMDLYDESLKKRRSREIPLGRIGTPEDVAPFISFLLSPGSQWITGQVFVIDGGEVRT